MDDSLQLSSIVHGLSSIVCHPYVQRRAILVRYLNANTVDVMNETIKPKLRPVQIHPVSHNGQEGFVLQDSLGLSKHMIFVPRALAPILALMDGTRTPKGLQVGLQLRLGIYVPLPVIERLIAQLDEALMLENERFEQARAHALAAYRRAPYRPLAHANAVYPEDPQNLASVLDEYGANMPPLPDPPPRPIRGVVSPHIDYARGGPIYAGVWTYTREAAQLAERVILLGTDHNGDFGAITLTRQNYATPYGVLPTDREIVDALVEAIGEEEAFREELHHRSEHSIELALVWLHHMRGGNPVPVVPVLLGSFAHFTAGEADPARDEGLNAAIRVLQEAAREKPTLVVAAADLAHVGPAFGDPQPWGMAEKTRLRSADEELMQAMIEGDAERFFRAIARVHDRYRICGLPPIYVLLRVLEGAQGVATGYDQCPADEQFGSVVSVCGVALW